MALEERARIDVERLRLPQALDAAEKATLLAPNDPMRCPARYLAADIAERLGDKALAVKYFEWLAARSFDDSATRVARIRGKFISL